MKRADQHIQQQIVDLIEACAGYWELRGIAREHITQMQLELEQHLQQAVSDGKSLEAVVGPNPAAFAEAWAREMRPRVFRSGARVLRGLVYALSVVSTSALLSQLLAHSPAFTFTLFAAYLLIGAGSAGPAPGRVDGELEHHPPFLELAREHRLAYPGCGTVLPGLLADLPPSTSLSSFH